MISNAKHYKLNVNIIKKTHSTAYCIANSMVHFQAVTGTPHPVNGYCLSIDDDDGHIEDVLLLVLHHLDLPLQYQHSFLVEV